MRTCLHDFGHEDPDGLKYLDAFHNASVEQPFISYAVACCPGHFPCQTHWSYQIREDLSYHRSD